MANMLQNASEWLSGVLLQNAGELVTYVRDAVRVESVSSGIGESVCSTLDASGMPVEVESTDFLIGQSDLTAGGIAEPQRGDQIERVVNGVTRVYDVVGPGGGACWRYSDRFGTLLRIHTKIGEVGA